jgi:hypothetical protein
VGLGLATASIRLVVKLYMSGNIIR